MKLKKVICIDNKTNPLLLAAKENTNPVPNELIIGRTYEVEKIETHPIHGNKGYILKGVRSKGGYMGGYSTNKFIDYPELEEGKEITSNFKFNFSR